MKNITTNGPAGIISFGFFNDVNIYDNYFEKIKINYAGKASQYQIVPAFFYVGKTLNY